MYFDIRKSDTFGYIFMLNVEWLKLPPDFISFFFLIFFLILPILECIRLSDTQM